MKPVMTRAEGVFTVFGRNGGMPGDPGSGQKEGKDRRGEVRYVNSDPGHPL
ncbi:hypothetical protein R991_004019 [Salmonella enterica]|nr:hypothetical protein [Salmonella enterica]